MSEVRNKSDTPGRLSCSIPGCQIGIADENEAGTVWFTERLRGVFHGQPLYIVHSRLQSQHYLFHLWREVDVHGDRHFFRILMKMDGGYGAGWNLSNCI